MKEPVNEWIYEQRIEKYLNTYLAQPESNCPIEPSATKQSERQFG